MRWRLWDLPAERELQVRRDVCTEDRVRARLWRQDLRRRWLRRPLRDVCAGGELQLRRDLRHGGCVHAQLWRQGVWGRRVRGQLRLRKAAK